MHTSGRLPEPARKCRQTAEPAARCLRRACKSRSAPRRAPQPRARFFRLVDHLAVAARERVLGVPLKHSQGPSDDAGGRPEIVNGQRQQLRIIVFVSRHRCSGWVFRSLGGWASQSFEPNITSEPAILTIQENLFRARRGSAAPRHANAPAVFPQKNTNSRVLCRSLRFHEPGTPVAYPLKFN